MPIAQSVAIMLVLDQVREQVCATQASDSSVPGGHLADT
jgi:hypothetical protein